MLGVAETTLYERVYVYLEVKPHPFPNQISWYSTMQRLPRNVILSLTIPCPRTKHQPPLRLGLIRDHHLQVKLLLVHDHNLEKEEGLYQVELILAKVCGQLGLGRVVEEHDETLAGLVVGFLYGAVEGPLLQGVLV